MCVLSHEDIVRAIEKGELVIEPKPEVVGPDSVDLHWSGRVIVIRSFRAGALDIRNEQVIAALMEEREYEDFVLHRGEVVNAFTAERIILPNNLIARVTAKSSLARIGLGVGTAVLAHAGWRGNLNLELVNLGRNPIVLYRGMAICQLTFETLSSPTHHPYGSRGDERYREGGSHA